MSSVVSFYRVQRSDLADGGELAELLTGATEVGEDYGWSGNVMRNLLTAMAAADVVLGAGLTEEVQADEDGLVYLATADDIEAIESLDLDDLDEDSLGNGLDMDEAEVREAMTESLTLLRELIAGTGPDEVLVISID